ncbi:MAG: metallophosphoesterase, partial [Acetobacteraceae bacterium]|nr:metallophosphoesterase [Acetobacteraceae bacterium]
AAVPARWRVAHLSDIHLVGEPHGFRLECGRHGPRGNARFEAALAALAGAGPLDLVLITGDITDAGRNAEWIAFDAAAARHPALRERMLILPGNHDVNIVDRASPARLELPTSAGPWLRRLRCLAAMDALQGGRVRVMAADQRGLGPTLSDWLATQGRGAAMAAYLDAGRRPSRRAPHPREVWMAAFPMVLPPVTRDGLGVLLLDSNAQTHFSFTNALGVLAAQELHAAERVMAAWPDARWLVCLHHHLVEYPRAGVTLADRVATALTNGHWVQSRLARQAGRVVVLHGHRHTDWAGSAAGLRILSAPSPVMGAGHFWVQGFAPGAEGGLVLCAPERVMPAQGE